VPSRSRGASLQGKYGQGKYGQGKYGHGVALSPQAEALAEALLRLDGDDALRGLLALHGQGNDLDSIEESALEPALRKVGELWLRGRIDDARFDQINTLAEAVEVQFRLSISGPPRPR
jgi:hypothetical protein